MLTHTVRLHRVLRCKPELVYRAFTESHALAKWLPPDEFTCQVHEMDAKVGGCFRMSFTHFASGQIHSFGGKYLELVPHERIRYTDKFDDPSMAGEIQVAVELKAVSCGVELVIVQSGIPSVIPVEDCYVGWQQSLLSLARLVESRVAA